MNTKWSARATLLNLLNLFAPKFSPYLSTAKQDLDRNQFNFGGEKLTLEYLRNFKKSNTIFILGNGPTAANLPKSLIKEIDSCDSFGLNYWILHSLRPTYYSIELGPSQDKKLEEKVAEQFYSKNWQKDGTVYLQKCRPMFDEFSESLTTFFVKDNDHFRWVVPMTFSSNFRRELQLMIFLWRALKKGRNYSNVLNIHSSAAFATSVALQLGYENIVYVGVDLLGCHFYRHRAYSGDLDDTELWHGEVIKQESNINGLTTTKTIKALVNSKLNIADTNVYVFGEKSLLMKEFARWKH